MPPVGFPSYNHDFMVTYSLLAANQVMSLIFDGVFERFPTLKIIFVEHAFSWILPLMWRMDAIYDARKSWTGHQAQAVGVRQGAHQVHHPAAGLSRGQDRADPCDRVDAGDKILLFSSDYPHWTFDDPRWLIKHLPVAAREAVMFKNGIAAYHLPETVPALEGQIRVSCE